MARFDFSEPPAPGTSERACNMFWADFHEQASPEQRASFTARGIDIPDLSGSYDCSTVTFEKADNRYKSQPDLSALAAANEKVRQIKLDAAAADLQKRVAIAQAKHDAHQAVARDLFYAYHARIQAGPVPAHSQADSARDIKEKYIAARGFDPRSTVELDRYNAPTFRLNGYSREAWAKATLELDTNAQARHEMYVAEAQARTER
jgi:hypothetical protein